MSHSRGFLRGTCPGTLRKSGRAHDGIQQWKCGRCGAVYNKKVRACWRHQFENSGEPDHGRQKQKCAKCGRRTTAQVSACGFLQRCRYHRCDKVTGLHCRRCGRGRG